MDLQVKLVPWGASYGLRVRKKDVERLGLRPGQTLRIRIPDFTQEKDLSHWPSWHMGGNVDHDEGFEAL